MQKPQLPDLTHLQLLVLAVLHGGEQPGRVVRDCSPSAIGPAARQWLIVSQAIEQRFFAGESAVGRTVKIGDTTAEIVGVVFAAIAWTLAAVGMLASCRT